MPYSKGLFQNIYFLLHFFFRWQYGSQLPLNYWQLPKLHQAKVDRVSLTQLNRSDRQWLPCIFMRGPVRLFIKALQLLQPWCSTFYCTWKIAVRTHGQNTVHFHINFVQLMMVIKWIDWLFRMEEADSMETTAYKLQLLWDCHQVNV